jgi:dTDP-4-dehydrorhamnose 3,5-epimerase
MFTIQETPLDGVKLLLPQIHRDDRGTFMETYHKLALKDVLGDQNFVQNNVSISCWGTLRGMHFQKKYPQAKLVTVLQGRAFDVVVDIRPGETQGKWWGTYLSAGKWWGTLSDKEMAILYVPEGFAHGFLALSENTILSYMCSEVYHPEDEDGIRYNDPAIGIEWPIRDANIKLSKKDQEYQPFTEKTGPDRG